MSQMDSSYDVAIVGGGIGGLTCGSYLVTRGCKVLIIEKEPKLGGYVTSFNRRGFRFDGGAEGLLGCGENGYLRRWLSELGLPDVIRFKRIDPLEFVQIPGMRFPIHADLSKFQEELYRLLPDEKEGISKFFDNMLKMADEIGRGADRPPKGPLEMMKYAVKYPTLTNFYGRKHMSFQDVIDEYVQDVRLKIVLGLYCVWLGIPPWKVPCPVAASILDDVYRKGNYYPEGGMGSLVEQMTKTYVKNGGSLLLRTTVSKILVEDGRAVGVETEDGRRISSKHVVSNADCKQTFLGLVGEEHLKQEFLDHIKSIQPSISGVLVFLGVDTDLSDYPSHISYGDNPDTFKILERIRLNPVDGPIEDNIPGLAIRISSNLEPSYAPKGKSSVVLLALTPYNYRDNWKTGPKRERTSEYRELKKEVAKRLVRMAENAIPDLGEHIEVIDIATPLTFERYSWQEKGGWYGPAMDQDLPSQNTPIANLILAGSNTIGAGVPRAMLSGRQAAKRILPEPNA